MIKLSNLLNIFISISDKKKYTEASAIYISIENKIIIKKYRINKD